MKRPFGSRLSRGFTILELTITMAIGASIAAVINTNKIISESENSLAQGYAQYLLVVRDGLVEYQRQYFTEIAANTAVTGVAVLLSPTVAELKALGLLNNATPDTGPFGFVPTIAVTRSNCPGLNCSLMALVYTPSSMVVPRTGTEPRYDMADTAVMASGGAGGMSYAGDTTTLHGPSFNVANPIGGNPGAVFGVVSFFNTAAFNQFVRVNDTRDPNLQGNLSAVGALAITGTSTLTGNTSIGGTLGVTGSTTLTGAVVASSTVAATGAVTSAANVGAGAGGGCNRAEMLANGQIVSRSDCAGTNQTTIDPTASQVTMTTGGVNRVTTIATGAGQVALRDATNALRTRLLDTGVVETYDAGGVVRTSLDGAAGRGTMQMVNITSSGTVGDACATPNDVVLDSSASGTLLLCAGGVWRSPGLSQGTAGAACPTTGALAQDGAGAAMICRNATWQSVNDRVSRSVMMARYLVTDGTSIPKPVCPVGSVQAVVVIPSESGADYANSPPRNRFTGSAVDSGAAWTAFMRLSDGTGTAFSTSFGGAAYNFQGIATTYCDFPS